MTVLQFAKYLSKPPSSSGILDERLESVFVKCLLRSSPTFCFSTTVMLLITNNSGRSFRLLIVLPMTLFTIFEVFFTLDLYFAIN